MTPPDHVTATLLERYAAGDGIVAEALWAVEAHLEWCATCRERLVDPVNRRSPDAVALLVAVLARLAE